MKHYIGTKTVKAEPMTMGEAYKRGLLQAGRIPTAAETEKPGYYVQYENGYESWSPADVFEAAYKPAETFRERLRIEATDLMERLEKCASFVDSDKFRETIKEDYPAFLLALQREVMSRYLQILICRENIADGFTEDIHIKRMPFGIAVEALKWGFRISRQRWNGNGLFVIKEKSSHSVGGIFFDWDSLLEAVEECLSNDEEYQDTMNVFLLHNERTGETDIWIPTITDILAEDWEILI